MDKNRNARWRPILAVGLSLVLFRARQTQAYEVQVDAQVVGQGYQLRAADSSIVDRRRLTTYVGLSIWNLGPTGPDGLPALHNQWNVSLLLRFDADMGTYLCNIGRSSLTAPLECLSPERGGISTQPELSNNRPELLYAYAEGRNLFGYLDVRLGRQLQWELFDLRAFDGLWAEVHTPLYVAAQVWGGLNVTGALPIDSPIYALDGTSHTPQNDALQPTVGFAVRSYGFRDLQARLAYRRTFSAPQDLAPPGCPIGGDGRRTECAPSQPGTIEERLSYTLRGRILDGRIIGWGGFRYDFVSGRIDDGNAGVRGYLTPMHSLSAEYVFNAPTWDGDSIFNVFAASPYNDVRLSWDGRWDHRYGQLRPHLRVFARRFEDEAGRRALGSQVVSSPWAYGAIAGARLDRRAGFLRLDVYYEDGYGGLRTGADASGRLMLLRDHLGLEGRLTYMYWTDGGRAENNTHSLGLQAGARYALTRGVLLHLLVENNINRFYASQLRLVALLDLSYYLGGSSGGAAPAGLMPAGMGGFPPPSGRLL
ncbi:MAG: hypothetical protein RMK29_18345 [Myxococcales bacterium]|nr:hypothetical protein [Myxococcota bacterium]MDW8283669.1 hypothetical protein [Myxococcales bacterium]